MNIRSFAEKTVTDEAAVLKSQEFDVKVRHNESKIYVWDDAYLVVQSTKSSLLKIKRRHEKYFCNLICSPTWYIQVQKNS